MKKNDLPGTWPHSAAKIIMNFIEKEFPGLGYCVFTFKNPKESFYFSNAERASMTKALEEKAKIFRERKNAPVETKQEVEADVKGVMLRMKIETHFAGLDYIAFIFPFKASQSSLYYSSVDRLKMVEAIEARIALFKSQEKK